MIQDQNSLRKSGLLMAFCSFLILGCAHKKVSLKPESVPNAYRIAVVPFESSNPYLSGVVFSDYFTVQILSDIPRLAVIERKDLMKILQEQKLTLTGITRQEKFTKLGSILGVDAILVGSVHTLETIQSAGGTISVTVKLMEVQTGKILWAGRQKITHTTWSPSEVTEVADALMGKTASKMVKKMEKVLKPETLSSLRTEEDNAVLESKLTLLKAR